MQRREGYKDLCVCECVCGCVCLRGRLGVCTRTAAAAAADGVWRDADSTKHHGRENGRRGVSADRGARSQKEPTNPRGGK